MEMFESNTNWIMALGKTLVHSLWIGLFLLALLKLVFVFISARNSKARYQAAFAALLVNVLAIVSLFLFLYRPVFVMEINAGGIGLQPVAGPGKGSQVPPRLCSREMARLAGLWDGVTRRHGLPYVGSCLLGP